MYNIYIYIYMDALCVSCFFLCPVVPPTSFFLPRFSSWPADMEKLTWKSLESGEFTRQNHTCFFFIDVSRT